jgi:large subunit ribosomal protein L17
MRHHVNVRKFGREKNGRVALIRGLAASLIEHGRMLTTEAKAKKYPPQVFYELNQALL